MHQNRGLTEQKWCFMVREHSSCCPEFWSFRRGEPGIPEAQLPAPLQPHPEQDTLSPPGWGSTHHPRCSPHAPHRRPRTLFSGTPAHQATSLLVGTAICVLSWPTPAGDTHLARALSKDLLLSIHSLESQLNSVTALRGPACRTWRSRCLSSSENQKHMACQQRTAVVRDPGAACPLPLGPTDGLPC